jgi:hypothetical protein
MLVGITGAGSAFEDISVEDIRLDGDPFLKGNPVRFCFDGDFCRDCEGEICCFGLLGGEGVVELMWRPWKLFIRRATFAEVRGDDGLGWVTIPFGC